MWKKSCHKRLFPIIDIFESCGNQNFSPSPYFKKLTFWSSSWLYKGRSYMELLGFWKIFREIVWVWKYKFDFKQPLVSFLLFLFSSYTRLSYTAYFNTYLSDLTFAYNANLVTAHNNLICAVTNAILIDLRSSSVISVLCIV